MMSEFRRAEENEMRRDAVDVRSRRHTRNTDCTDRPKPNHIQPSQGPLSSLKAVIRGTKTNSQSEQRRDRRRPEITVLSAEPLDSNNWCPGGPLVFSAPRTPPPQVGWCADSQTVSQPPPSYDQVLKEKTKEEHVVKPVAAPRRLNYTSTSSTQTEHTTAAAPKTAGKKPQKPPRPSLPKNKNTFTGTAGPTNINLKSASSQENQTTESNLTGSSHSNCTKSVTVYWDNTSSPETTSTTSTTSSSIQRPVPLPRIKSKKPHILSEEPQTLVKLSENPDTTLNCNVDSVSSSKYLEELLEVFSAENCEIVNQSSAEVEDADEMSTTNSFRARIKAFENQAEEVSESVKPLPQGRKPSIRPPVAAKPSLATKPQFSADDFYENVSSLPPTPAPKPPKKPVGVPNSVKAELDAILAKARAQKQSRPSVLTSDDSIHDEDFAKGPPTPPVKPPKEPLRPNLNINNHNATALVEYDFGKDISKGLEGTTFNEYEYVDTTSIEAGGPIANEYDIVDDTPQGPDDTTVREYEYTPKGPEQTITREYDYVANTYVDKTSNNFPFKPQQTMDNFAASRQSVTKRPTIIVPNRPVSFSDALQDNPPPLPFQKPVGTLNAPLTNRHSVASFPPQVSNSAAPEPTLPPRRLTTSKTLPPRPPSVKSGPGRPPAPRMEASGRSYSTPWDTAPKPQALKPQSKGPVLPPRPNPGHRLYNKYTLQVPHAIAACDYNGSNTGELSFQRNEVLLLLNDTDPNTFECQVGDKRGPVHKSRLKVITPLSAASDVTPSQGAPVASANGLTVQVLYDFSPENPGELALQAGDVVTMVKQVDNEWYSGLCRGSAGFFPINYVKVVADSPQLPERKPRKPPASVSGPRCVARFDFEGEHSDELTFSEGDVIQLKAYVGQEWVRGQLGAFTGIFPLQFVEIIEDLPPAPSQQHTQPTKIALPGMAKSSPAEVAQPAQSSQPSVEWAVALYDFSGNTEGDLSFEKGDRILITQHLNEQWSSGRLNGREGMFPRAFVESKTGQTSSTNQNQNGAAGGVRARALYDFASDCEEELSIKVGDIITNVESVDDEWFLGDLRGKRALVPKNYVQVM